MGVSVRAAKKVVVIGGGPCGIEMAGEVRDANPTADITLVHSGSALLSGKGNQISNPKLHAKLMARLASRKITTLLGTRVGEVVQGTAHASMGAAVTVGPCECKLIAGNSSNSATEFTKLTSEGLVGIDLVINAVGSGKPNTAWLANSPLASALDESGAVLCGRSYAVSGFEENIFTFGDCAAGPDAKAGWLLDDAAAVVCANIRTLALASLNAANNTLMSPKLKEAPKDGYTGIILIPIGAKDGAGQLPFGVVGPWVTSAIKGDLFLGMVASEFGYTKAELLAWQK